MEQFVKSLAVLKPDLLAEQPSHSSKSHGKESSSKSSQIPHVSERSVHCSRLIFSLIQYGNTHQSTSLPLLPASAPISFQQQIDPAMHATDFTRFLNLAIRCLLALQNDTDERAGQGATNLALAAEESLNRLIKACTNSSVSLDIVLLRIIKIIILFSSTLMFTLGDSSSSFSRRSVANLPSQSHSLSNCARCVVHLFVSLRSLRYRGPIAEPISLRTCSHSSSSI